MKGVKELSIPKCEGINILLDHHPGVEVDRFGSSQLDRQILGVNVVEQLGGVGQVEDVKVVEILVHQFAKSRLVCNIGSD